MSVMFSTTTGVFIFTDIRKRVRAAKIKKDKFRVRLSQESLKCIQI